MAAGVSTRGFFEPYSTQNQNHWFIVGSYCDTLRIVFWCLLGFFNPDSIQAHLMAKQTNWPRRKKVWCQLFVFWTLPMQLSSVLEPVFRWICLWVGIVNICSWGFKFQISPAVCYVVSSSTHDASKASADSGHAGLSSNWWRCKRFCSLTKSVLQFFLWKCSLRIYLIHLKRAA